MLNLNSVQNGFGFTARYDRQVDVCPCSNVNRCDVVGGSSKTTLNTLKQPSVWTISFPVCSADRADMACSSGIYSDYGYPLELCLVFDKAAELVESPTAKATTLSFIYRYSFPNALQVFKGNSSLSVKSFSHQTFGDHIIERKRQYLRGSTFLPRLKPWASCGGIL